MQSVRIGRYGRDIRVADGLRLRPPLIILIDWRGGLCYNFGDVSEEFKTHPQILEPVQVPNFSRRAGPHSYRRLRARDTLDNKKRHRRDPRV